MTLEVTQGSVVSVDTDELRWAAVRLDGAAVAAGRAYEAAGRARMRIAMLDDPFLLGADVASGALDADALALRVSGIAVELRRAADVYEAVELASIAAMGGDGAQAALEGLAELHRDDPSAVATGIRLMFAWRMLAGAELPAHFATALEPFAHGAGPSAAMSFLGALSLFRMAKGMGPGALGEPGRTAARQGVSPRVSQAAVPMLVGRLRFQAPPASLAEALSRIPNGEGIIPRPGHGSQDRVRIDRLRMSSGESRYLVYITGSREAPWQTDDPFSWSRNLGLYEGAPDSDGYEFVLDALRRAGAEEGDVVDAHGFSQGAMIAQRIATDSGFDVQRVTTIGSPLHIPVGEGTTAITLLHDDDPVAALADGGSPVALGSDDSIVVSRAYEPEHTGPFEMLVRAHRVGAYAETAEMFAQSGDSRAEGVAAYYAMLSRAESVDTFVFEAPEHDASDADP